jgi:hypothetical protein
VPSANKKVLKKCSKSSPTRRTPTLCDRFYTIWLGVAGVIIIMKEGW